MDLMTKWPKFGYWIVSIIWEKWSPKPLLHSLFSLISCFFFLWLMFHIPVPITETHIQMKSFSYTCTCAQSLGGAECEAFLRPIFSTSILYPERFQHFFKVDWNHIWTFLEKCVSVDAKVSLQSVFCHAKDRTQRTRYTCRAAYLLHCYHSNSFR